MAKTGAVRKGGLLRGKVSQRSPSPLKHSVKGTPRPRSQTIEKPNVFKACPQKVSKNIVCSLLVEIAAAVDKEPGEPGEVVDGGTKK